MGKIITKNIGIRVGYGYYAPLSGDVTNISNGRMGLIYVHKTSHMVMNGGSISDNTVYMDYASCEVLRGPIDVLNEATHTAETFAVKINGGSITGNMFVFGDGVSRESAISFSTSDDLEKNYWLSLKDEYITGYVGDGDNYPTQN